MEDQTTTGSGQRRLKPQHEARRPRPDLSPVGIGMMVGGGIYLLSRADDYPQPAAMFMSLAGAAALGLALMFFLIGDAS